MDIFVEAIAEQESIRLVLAGVSSGLETHHLSLLTPDMQ